MKTTSNEDLLKEKYLKEGYKCIRKGYPDFVFYKEDLEGNTTDVRFVEHKLNRDILTKEQVIFKKICENLNLNYSIVREKDFEEETTTLVVSKKLRDFLDKKGKRNETFDDIIKRLVDFK